MLSWARGSSPGVHSTSHRSPGFCILLPKLMQLAFQSQLDSDNPMTNVVVQDYSIMAKRSAQHQHSDASRDQAMRIARGTQRPGQTKEQTKLISQGIQKGIEQYKKQQNARARELDKKLKKARQQQAAPEAHGIEIPDRVIYRQHWLPWVLLVLSWLGMAVYWFAR